MTEEELNKLLSKYAPKYYDMDGKEITRDEWSRTLCTDFNKHIGDDEINGYRVSTVWLGLDHGFRMSQWLDKERDEFYRPVIFETMIFAEEEMPAIEELYQYQKRYSTKEQALEGHKAACELVRAQTK